MLNFRGTVEIIKQASDIKPPQDLINYFYVTRTETNKFRKTEQKQMLITWN